MSTIFASVIAFAIAMLALSLGHLLGRGAPRGSCGGGRGTCTCRNEREGDE